MRWLGIIIMLVACEAPPAARRAEAIRLGVPAEADEAVVALLEDAALVCTGTVIHPRVVLTAAHCVEGRTVTSVSVERAGEVLQSLGVLDVELHPLWPAEPDADVALVLLDDEAAVTPIPLAAGLGQEHVGSLVRIVGFGLAPDAVGGGKREGTARIDSVEDETFRIAPAPSMPCPGDSGGPAFLEVDGVEVLAGVVSRGDEACNEWAIYVRADAVAPAFVMPYVADLDAADRAPGERCLVDEQCASGDCRFVEDAVAYCTTSCDTDDDCPAPMTCDGASCAHAPPYPGTLGWACAADDECDSGICVGVCSQNCYEAGGACPDGLACEAVDGREDRFFCLPPSGSGGCAVAGRGAPWIPALVALLAVAILNGRPKFGRKP